MSLNLIGLFLVEQWHCSYNITHCLEHNSSWNSKHLILAASSWENHECIEDELFWQEVYLNSQEVRTGSWSGVWFYLKRERETTMEVWMSVHTCVFWMSKKQLRRDNEKQRNCSTETGCKLTCVSSELNPGVALLEGHHKWRPVDHCLQLPPGLGLHGKRITSKIKQSERSLQLSNTFGL